MDIVYNMFTRFKSKGNVLNSIVRLKIFDEALINYGKSLLNILLKDRTTNRNIIWATNDYIQLGDIYAATNEISIDIINDYRNDKFIQPRITKSFEKQNNRTREMAEVFTPSWVCNCQNNLIDEHWFGRKDVFNTHIDKNWTPTDRKIDFPNRDGKTWKDYVYAKRLEIACGEAPYLVSRYDTVTGEVFPLHSRIGLLDRKMRVVNENTNDETEWIKWTKIAFQNIYGYEFQGDNLLLARENLLYTFIENYQYKLDREPSLGELKTMARIISWNIWQMDGLTNKIPFSNEATDYTQLLLFESPEVSKDKTVNKYCKIKNWESGAIIEYRTFF